MTTYLTKQDRRQTVQLIHQHQVLERSWLEKESVSFLQGHGGGELRLLVVISQMGYLVQVTSDTKEEHYHSQSRLQLQFSHAFSVGEG